MPAEHPAAQDHVEPTTIYVVPTGRWISGDFSGLSVTADRVWFQHVSSSLGYLRRDTTDGFSDRRVQLEEAYPNGYKVVLVLPDEDLPAEIAHHFTENADAAE